ncbi:MAG: response regulator [Thermodesulfobacteriota bacterium]
MTDKETFKPRVLVVDDEKRIREVCYRMLTQEGFEVARAESGEAGLEMIGREHFDLILLDLMMPGLSGFEVLEKVKAQHPDTAIIVITGYATVEHSIEAMKKGAFDFIPKPFSPQDLKLMVTKALEYIRTLKDITHEKSRMRVLINHLAGGVLAVDAEKTVALANPAFLKMVGWKGEAPAGRPADELVKEEKLLKMMDQALALPSDRLAELNEEIEDGETVLHVRCVPFRDRAGRTLGAITVLHDITAAKKMDKLKSDFVSMVAHEIRSPLNSVLMQFKVILDGLAGEVTGKQKDILNRSAERIKALVEMSTELLDLAKIEAGLMTQEKERTDLAPLLAGQVEFHRAKAEAKGISLDLAPCPGLPPVLANAGNIEEVISNLITNAINYTPSGGRVTVGAEVEGANLRLYVRDTGFGLSGEDQVKIFERFYRVKNEKTRYITGTGLGLPIVKSIVEAHNGQIKVESAPGRGSTFQVYLPILDS